MLISFIPQIAMQLLEVLFIAWKLLKWILPDKIENQGAEYY